MKFPMISKEINRRFDWSIRRQNPQKRLINVLKTDNMIRSHIQFMSYKTGALNSILKISA